MSLGLIGHDESCPGTLGSLWVSLLWTKGLKAEGPGRVEAPGGMAPGTSTMCLEQESETRLAGEERSDSSVRHQVQN